MRFKPLDFSQYVWYLFGNVITLEEDSNSITYERGYYTNSFSACPVVSIPLLLAHYEQQLQLNSLI